MPEKQFLDYEGLEHYHKKVKESLSSGGGGSALEKQIRENRRDIDLLFERSDLIANNLSRVDVSVLDGSNQPLQNYQIIGLKAKDGTGDVYTNEFGEATGYITAGSRTIQVKSPYIDVKPWSKSGTFVAGERYLYEATLEYLDFVEVYSSGDIVFSTNVHDISFSLIGGGGGGGASTHASSSNRSVGGGGGGGGYVANGTANIEPDVPYLISLGAGGTGGKAGWTSSMGYQANTGGTGGTSSFLNISAVGGNGGSAGATKEDWSFTGGSGNGRGGNGGTNSGSALLTNASVGTAGTQEMFSSFTETKIAGGGGGGGGSGWSTDVVRLGGAPDGGSGGYYGSSYISATSGIRGGGGGGACYGATAYAGATGGSGYLAIRINPI